MKYRYKILYGFILCAGTSNFCSVSVVYNLKIAETTKRHGDDNGEHPSIASLTPFNQFREKYNTNKHNYTGSLFSYIFSPQSFYIRLDWAFAYVNAHDKEIHTFKVQTDDFLVSGGYSHELGKRSKCTFSGLVGIPTHKDDSILEPQFGYAHYSLGFQVDNSYIFPLKNQQYELRTAARILHFLKRNIVIDSDRYVFNIGNLADLFLAFHIHFAKHHIEFGYNPTLFFNASIDPFFEDALEKANFTRNSFYGSYKYKFYINKFPSAFACAVSYGFDFKPKIIGNKRMVTVWASWSINF